MRIIKQGREYNKEVIAVCNRCECEFAYNRNDIHADQRDGDYVVCPNCGIFINHKKTFFW